MNYNVTGSIYLVLQSPVNNSFAKWLIVIKKNKNKIKYGKNSRKANKG